MHMQLSWWWCWHFWCFPNTQHLSFFLCLMVTRHGVCTCTHVWIQGDDEHEQHVIMQAGSLLFLRLWMTFIYTQVCTSNHTLVRCSAWADMNDGECYDIDRWAGPPAISASFLYVFGPLFFMYIYAHESNTTVNVYTRMHSSKKSIHIPSHKTTYAQLHNHAQNLFCLSVCQEPVNQSTGKTGMLLEPRGTVLVGEHSFPAPWHVARSSNFSVLSLVQNHIHACLFHDVHLPKKAIFPPLR